MSNSTDEPRKPRPVLDYHGLPASIPTAREAPIVVSATPPPVWPEMLAAALGLFLLSAIGVLLLALVIAEGAGTEHPLQVVFLLLVVLGGGTAVFVVVLRMMLRLSRQGNQPIIFTIDRGQSITIQNPRRWDEPRTWRREEIDHIDVERVGRSLDGRLRFNARLFLVTVETVLIPLTAMDEGFADHLEDQLRRVTVPV